MAGARILFLALGAALIQTAAAGEVQTVEQIAQRAVEPFWRRNHFNRTVYFHPIGGLGNQLISIASLLETIRRSDLQMNVKFVYGARCSWEWCGDWYDYFSYPDLLVAPFPGGAWQMDGSEQCTPYDCHLKKKGETLKHFLVTNSNWETYNGEEVLCFYCGVHSWERKPHELEWVYSLLAPSPRIQELVDGYKKEVGWWSYQPYKRVSVHVRRTDFGMNPEVYMTIDKNKRLNVDYSSGHVRGNWDDLIYPYDYHVERWIEVMTMMYNLTGDSRAHTQFFLATDDDQVLTQIINAFPQGRVLYRTKDLESHPRGTVEGQYDSIVELFLLASANSLIGTMHSTFSQTAALVGNSGKLFTQVGCWEGTPMTCVEKATDEEWSLEDGCEGCQWE